jgi:hypothetical protein
MDDPRAQLSEHHRLAFELTDAFLTSPERLSASTRRAIEDEYSAEQIVELVVGLILRSQNRALLALNLDYPLDLEGATIVDDAAQSPA